MTWTFYQMFTTNLIVRPESFAQVLINRNVLDPDGCGLGIDPSGGPGLGITRDPYDGTVFCVDSGFGNAGKRLVQGVEATATYEIPTKRWGKFTFSGGYNHFFTWKAQPGVGPFNSFLGNYNNGTLPLAPGAIPWNKGFLRGEWEWRGFDFIATGNYIGDFRDDPSFNGDQTQVGGPDFTNPRESRRSRAHHARHAVELRICEPEAGPTYAKDAKDSKDARAARPQPRRSGNDCSGAQRSRLCEHAFDRNPPRAGRVNDNYDTSLHSIRNRFYYVAVSKNFEPGDAVCLIRLKEICTALESNQQPSD